MNRKPLYKLLGILGIVSALTLLSLGYLMGSVVSKVNYQKAVDAILEREAKLITSMNAKVQSLELQSSRLATDLVLSRTATATKQTEIVAEYRSLFQTEGAPCNVSLSGLSTSFINRMIQAEAE